MRQILQGRAAVAVLILAVGASVRTWAFDAPPDPAAQQGAPPPGAGAQSPPAVSPSEAKPQEPTVEGPKKPFAAGDGITFASSDGLYSMQFGVYGQFRFRVYDVQQWRRTDRSIITPPIPVEDIGETLTTFTIPLLRVYLRGNAFKPWLTYRIEANLVANDEGLREVFIPAVDPTAGFPGVNLRAGAESLDGRTFKLMDFYLDGLPRPYAGFRMGQFKVPFGRQELVPDPLLQLPERSVASNFFAPGRDRGVMFRGSSTEGKIGYQAGAFNGTGLVQAQNVDNSLAYSFRFTGTSGGPYLSTESVLDDPETFHAQGAVAWYSNTRQTTQTSDPLSLIGNIEDHRLDADLEFFWHRANLLMEYFSEEIQTDDSVQSRMEVICFGAFEQGLLTCKQKGFNVQGGVRLGDKHEIAGRYSRVDPDRDLEQDNLIEATLGYTLYFKKHALKWMTTLSAITLQVNAPGSSGLAVQRGDASIPIVPGFPNPGGFEPKLTDDHNKLFITQIQWMF